MARIINPVAGTMAPLDSRSARSVKAEAEEEVFKFCLGAGRGLGGERL